MIDLGFGRSFCEKQFECFEVSEAQRKSSWPPFSLLPILGILLQRSNEWVAIK
jgi:hypothetical protein